MFDALKNLGNLKDLMGKAQQMQGQMKQLQAELGAKTVTGDAGDERVVATVNGRMEVAAIKIDAARINTSDTAMLEDLILAAIRSAQSKAAAMMQTEMQKLTSEMGLPPGMLP